MPIKIIAFLFFTTSFSIALHAQDTEKLINYKQIPQLKSSEPVFLNGGNPIDLTAGNYLISTSDGLMELDIVNESFELIEDSNLENKHLRIAGDKVYLQDEYAEKIYVLDTVDSSFNLFAEQVDSESFVVGSDRIVAAKQYSNCGSHYIVFISSGNVFESSVCEDSWRSVNLFDDELYVSSYSKQSIRDLASPAFSNTTINDSGGAFFLEDIDNNYWVVNGSGQFKKYDQNLTLLGTYSTGRNYKHVSIRNDGLIVGETYNSLIVLKPDHFFQKEIDLYIYSNNSSGQFISDVIIDQDNDQLPYWFETFFNLDPEDGNDASLDGDSDGLNNLEEYINKTNPNDSDSDDDGINDGTEVSIGTDPLNPDSDEDGLDDGIEYHDLGSNPLAGDTDGDGIDDLTEFQFGLNLNVSNIGVDTDGDRINDLDEIQLGTSPINEDSDSDGMNDGDELDNGTDPLDSDSDDDQLSDGTENTLGTNPLNIDSDTDGLDDGLEVLTLLSNPLSTDTDNDSMTDDWEYLYGLDLLVDDTAGDLDGDNLSNLLEFQLGGVPTDDDTDNDLLMDGEEYLLGSAINDRDTDDDNMPDGWELINSTNLLVHDSDTDNDGDGINNGIEYWNRTDANDDNIYPVPKKWNTFQGNPLHTGYQPTSIVSARNTPDISFNVSTESVYNLNAATMNEDYIVVSYTDNLVAFDKQTTEEIWRQVYQVSSTNPPAIDDNRVYIQTGNHNNATHLRSYEIETGQLVFQSPHSAQWESYLAPTIENNTVYINGGSYGGAYAFDKITGDQKWFSSAFNQFDMWTPSIDENNAYGYTYGNLIAVDKLTGMQVYSIDDPSYDWHGYSTNRAVILGGYDTAIVSDQRNNTGHISVFDRIQGELLWTHILDYQSQMVASNGIIFSQSQSGVLYALKERTGEEVWNMTLPLGDSFIYNMVVTNDHLIFSGYNQTYFMNLSTQEIDFTIPFSGEKELSENNELLITADDGTIEMYQLLEDLIFTSSF